MKKVTGKIYLVIIQLVINLSKMVQTARGLTVIMDMIDERNTAAMLDFKDHLPAAKFNGGFRIVRLANDRTGKSIFVLMSTWTPIVRASVHPPDDTEGKAKLAETIQTASAKTLYVTINPILYGTVLTGLISNLRNAKGANQVTKAWNDLNKQLNKIMAVVQTCMDEDTTGSAAIICEYYGFHVIGKGGRTVNVFSGEPGIEVGSIDLILPKGPHGCAYAIKLYNAARTSFVYAQGTDIASATIGGLVPGSVQAVSVTHIISGKAQEESQIIEVNVK